LVPDLARKSDVEVVVVGVIVVLLVAVVGPTGKEVVVGPGGAKA